MKYNKMFKEKYENDYLSDLEGLIKIKSVLGEFNESKKYPFGKGIDDSLKYMLSLAKRDGFKYQNIDNYAGYIEYGSGEEELAILCHLDVVPAVGKWKYSAFEATVVDGVIYGRGVNDDKGPTMSAYYALKMLKDLKIVPNKRIRIILGTDEETGSRGIEYYLKHQKEPDLAFTPDATFPLVYAEKAIHSFDLLGEDQSEIISFKSGNRYNMVPDYAELELKDDKLKEEFLNYLHFYKYKGEVVGNVFKIHGQAAHALEPDVGENAIHFMRDFISGHFPSHLIDVLELFDNYGEKLKIVHQDDEMGAVTSNLAVCELKDGKFRIGINNRYPKGFNKLKQLIKTLNKYGTYKEVKFMETHYMEKDSELVKSLESVYRKVTGDNKTPVQTTGGGTYARALKNAVAFGPAFPGRPDVAHQKDEHMLLEDLYLGTIIYLESLIKLTK